MTREVFKVPRKEMAAAEEAGDLDAVKDLENLEAFRTTILGFSIKSLRLLKGIEVQYLSTADMDIYKKFTENKLSRNDIDRAIEMLARLPNNDKHIKNSLQFLAFLAHRLNNLSHQNKIIDPEKIATKYGLD